MRFFSNDARETPDDEARADERPERVKSEPVAVPTQRPSSPWAANPNTPNPGVTKPGVTNPSPADLGPGNLGAANSGLGQSGLVQSGPGQQFGPGQFGPGQSGPGQSGPGAAGQPSPGPVAGKRPEFHEANAQPTAFGASGDNGAGGSGAGGSGAGGSGAGGSVAALADAGPATSRGAERTDSDRTDEDWDLGSYDADGRSSFDDPATSDNPASRGGPIALGGRATPDDDARRDTFGDESTLDGPSTRFRDDDPADGDQPPASDPTALDATTPDSATSRATDNGSSAADAPATASLDGGRPGEGTRSDDDDDLTGRADDVVGDGAVDHRESTDKDADSEDASETAVAPDLDDTTKPEASTDKDTAADETPTEGGMLPGTVPQPELGRLFANADSHSFRDRWRDVQLLFVDDPKAAAEDAAGLVDEAVDALAASLRAQRQQLANAATATTGGDTEQLRVQLRTYRDFLDRLLGL